MMDQGNSTGSPAAEIVTPASECAAINKRAAEFIRTNDPFGDAFSEHDLRLLAGEPTRLPEYYECENCIGMIEHGCYCQAMGAVAPGGPRPTVEASEVSDDR